MVGPKLSYTLAADWLAVAGWMIGYAMAIFSKSKNIFCATNPKEAV